MIKIFFLDIGEETKQFGF